MILPVLLSALLAPPVPQDPPPVDEVLSALVGEYGTKTKKYESLASRVERAVAKALREARWGDDQPLAEHPGLVLVSELAEEALDTAKTRKRRNPEYQAAMLERYPWLPEVEYAIGLHLGSDRPIPDHDVGFIRLGPPVGPLPGYPELLTNHYLFGLREIVDWQFRVETKKDIAFLGRGPKDPPLMGIELPAYEALRLYLLGATPEVPLFAVPQLTHRIHARLAERRAAEVDGTHPVDESLAFLDARWDGYSFEAPYTEDRTPVLFNAHDLFADSQGFAFRFSISAQLHEVGDMPFICSATNQLYGRLFHGEDLHVNEYNEPYAGAAATVMEAFQAQSVYLARYKFLIAQLVRAVASPHLPYPAAMAYLDYPGGVPPTARELRDDLDVPRAHALLVWAAVGKDAAAYADWLYDNVFAHEANRFPEDVSLATAFTLAVRAQQADLLALVAANEDPLFQLEFSPYADPLQPEGETRTEYLLASFNAFHARTRDVIRDAAYAIVKGEID